MRTFIAGLVLVFAASAAASARTRHTASIAYEAEIVSHARAHGIPETLVHRVVLRESGYNPRLVNHGHYGLMQISYPTAVSMGYRGSPAGLLDPEVNLTYAVPYLANAYKAAGSSETGAVRLYSRGYYYVAKRQGLLAQMRSGSSASLAASKPVLVEPPVETNPLLRILGIQPSEPVTSVTTQ